MVSVKRVWVWASFLRVILFGKLVLNVPLSALRQKKILIKDLGIHSGIVQIKQRMYSLLHNAFPGKNKWVEEKKALNIWLNVCAIDADDLVHWLEIYPAVAQWLSVKIGHLLQGLRNIEESWSEWIHATRTPLTPDVIFGTDVMKNKQKSLGG